MPVGVFVRISALARRRSARCGWTDMVTHCGFARWPGDFASGPWFRGGLVGGYPPVVMARLCPPPAVTATAPLSVATGAGVQPVLVVPLPNWP